MTKSTLRASVAAAIGLAMARQAAMADTPPPADAAPPAIGEIVVTANKRSENLQKVPITIAAFTGKTLAAQGVESVVDLPELTPGLGFTRTLVGTNAFLRGVGTTSAGYSTEVPIATYVDGLYMPNSAASSFSFNNIERIEVLKGPQGTLYGRNTTGGLIHVVTREPGDTTALDTSVSYGNYNTTQLNFYGSTPLSDTVSANLAALYIDQADGWGHNVFTGRQTYTLKDIGLQSKILWRPSSDTRIELRGFFDKTITDEGNAVAVYPGTTAIDGSVNQGKYLIDSRITPYAQQRQYSISLKAEQELGFARLSSLTGYIDNNSPSQQTQSPNLGYPVLGKSTINLDGVQQAHTFSEELQLTSSNSASPLQWIVGAYYYHDRSTLQIDVFGTCIAAICDPNPMLIPTQTTGRQATDSIAGYADGTYTIAAHTRLTVGLRYTSDHKDLSGSLVALQGHPNSIPALPPSVVTSPSQAIVTSATFGKPTWRAVLAQDVIRDVHAFVSYNRGFKSGGFNPTSFTNPVSRPEVLDAFEGGIKSELFDRRLRLNASGFYYNYRDMQLRTSAPPAPPGSTILYNAASAHIKGIDLDFEASPLTNLVINGGMEVLDARYASFPGAVCTTLSPSGFGTVSRVCNLSGGWLPQAPKFSYTLGATYTVHAHAGTAALNVNDGYKSSFAWEPDNRLRQGAYHLLNAALTLTPQNSRFSVQVYGRNLTNTYYFVSGANGGGSDGDVPGAPRTYGVKLEYTFR
jgi:iron complex outermembrane recepter protein